MEVRRKESQMQREEKHCFRVWCLTSALKAAYVLYLLDHNIAPFETQAGFPPCERAAGCELWSNGPEDTFSLDCSPSPPLGLSPVCPGPRTPFSSPQTISHCHQSLADPWYPVCHRCFPTAQLWSQKRVCKPEQLWSYVATALSPIYSSKAVALNLKLSASHTSLSYLCQAQAANGLLRVKLDNCIWGG